MNGKTLGEIAHDKARELHQTSEGDGRTFNELTAAERATWEAIAEAVKEEVRSWSDPRSRP